MKNSVIAFFLTILLFVCIVPASFASKPCCLDSYSIAVGWGRPNHLRGARFAIQKDWRVRWFPFLGWHLSGYWDGSIAYWRTNGNRFGQYKNMTIVGFDPIFRWQSDKPWGHTITPYLEAAVGIAGLSKRHLGHRSMGANWAFQDLLGFGVTFGYRQQYDISAHYLHYSNADIKRPNNGIDVKVLLMFTYHFTNGMV